VIQKTLTKSSAWTVLFALVCGSVAFAQAPQQAPTPAKSAAVDKAIVTLKVQVTLSRYEGEKKIESLPFTFWANSDGGPVSLNNALRVPLPGTPIPNNYQNVGTGIEASASSLDDGRFKIALTINDSSVLPSKASESSGLPTFKSFTVSNYVLLRDGQTGQFATTTDKVSGEVTRVDVTITVLK
jgi:hypothetical protein